MVGSWSGAKLINPWFLRPPKLGSGALWLKLTYGAVSGQTKNRFIIKK